MFDTDKSSGYQRRRDGKAAPANATTAPEPTHPHGEVLRLFERESPLRRSCRDRDHEKITSLGLTRQAADDCLHCGMEDIILSWWRFQNVRPDKLGPVLLDGDESENETDQRVPEVREREQRAGAVCVYERDDISAVSEIEQECSKLTGGVLRAVGDQAGPGDDMLANGGDEILLRRYVVVERTWLHIEVVSNPSHRESREPVLA